MKIVHNFPISLQNSENFSEVTKLSEDIKKTWLQENQKEIKNIINKQTFLVQYPEKGDPVTI